MRTIKLSPLIWAAIFYAGTILIGIGPAAHGAVTYQFEAITPAGNEVNAGNSYLGGEKVMVIQGPMKGKSGIFQKYKGKDRVIVNIDILNQSASVDVDEDAIQRI